MHRIFLVPGFFGFTSLGELRYFKHVHGYLEDSLAEQGVAASVHEVDTRPTAALERRAMRLHERMAEVLEPGDRVHVVAHSSGGLDARLLVSPQGAARLHHDVEPVAEQVASIVTVATPHRGTPSAAAFDSIAGRRLLQVLSLLTVVVIRQGRLPLRVALKLGKLLQRLEDQLDEDVGLEDELFTGLLGELDAERRDKLAAFFREVRSDQTLLPQITPASMRSFNEHVADRPGVRYASVVTRARRPGLRGALAGGVSPMAHGSFGLYVACHRLARGRGPSMEAALPALRPSWADVALADNDGMVPTASQRWGKLLATVDADHLDVIGHFSSRDLTPPHYDWLRTGTGFDREGFEATWSAVLAHLLEE